MNINELLEPNAKKAVFTFGRFNPPTKGHARLMDVVKNAASGADHYVFTGRTNDPKKNPLEYKEKITFLRAMFPHMNIMDNPAIRTPWEALEELGKQYDEVIMVVGSDRKQDFETQMRPYLKDFGIEKFSIISSGERDADASDVAGVSASKARAFARAGDFKSFSQTIDGGEKLKTQLYNKVRQGMGVAESIKEYAVTQQRPKIAVINNISMRKDNTPFALSYKDTGGASTDGKFYITPQVAKKFMNFYDRQPDDNQALMQKALKTITGTAKLFNQLNLKFDAKLPPDYNDMIEMAKEKMPKDPKIKSRDPNWRDMEALRKSGAAGSHKDKKALDKRGYKKHKGKSYDINEAESKPIAYVDMDGVIANFFAEYAKLAGVKSGNYRDIPPAKTDPTLNKMIGTDFFNRLPKFPTTDKLIQLVVKEFGSYKILSSPLRGDHENSKQQKIKWIQRELGIQPDEIIVVGRKESYAVQADGTPNILIDDRGRNIEGWRSRGGYGIKYQADEDPLSKVVDGIKEFKEKNNLTEHGGRVVKGINTTADVGVDAIKKQSAKFGFKVTKDGVPPILAPKNLRRVKRMQEALIKINGSNKNLTLQQQIDLQEIKKGITQVLEATKKSKSNPSEVPYQNQGGQMSLLTHPGTAMHQKMRATAKPGTDEWFKTWRTLAYLTKGRKNHYMLPVKEELEKLLIKHGILESPVQINSVKNQNIERTVNDIENKVKANPETVGIVQQGIQKLKALLAKATGQEQVAEEPEMDIAVAGQPVSPAIVSATLQNLESIESQIKQLPDGPLKDQMVITLRELTVNIDKEKKAYGKEQYGKGQEEEKAKSSGNIKRLNSEIELLARKVANYQDPDPGTKYDSKQKKVQANAEMAKEKLTQGLFSLFFNYVYFKNELTEQQVISFVKDCVAGNVVDMPAMVKAKQGTIDQFVKKHKDVYDIVVNDLINYKGEAGTGGALGPAEILLSAIGSPVSTGTGGVKGDLAVNMPDGKILGVEVKAGSQAKGSGARLNGTSIQDGKGALANMKRLYADLGITVDDLEKKSYTISEKYLATLNKKLATFNNAKLNQYVVGVLQALVTNYDEVYKEAESNIKKMIDNAIQPGTENGPIVFNRFRNLITYVQLVSYKLSDGVETIMTIDTGKRSFSITGTPEEFVNQIGTRHVQAASLSITNDPQTASFHWRSV